MNKKIFGILMVVMILVCAAVFGGIYMTRHIGKSEKVVSKESAEKRLAKMVDKINPQTGTPAKSPLSTTRQRMRRMNCRILIPVPFK